MRHLRGIIFQAENVRAILAGTKLQTRRLVKLPDFCASSTDGYDWQFRDRRSLWNDYRADRIAELCPYGRPGSLLYVKETWQRDGARVVFRATDHRPDGIDEGGDYGTRKWKSPLHLARADARIHLRITDVRVQRVQSITEIEAKAEGVPPFFERYDRIGKDQRIACDGEENFLAIEQPYRASYACMWDEINGDTALWSANPFVWALTFEVMQ